MTSAPGAKGVFVFGSNLLGIHGRGAALYARRHYGAKLGVGEGPTGRAYALPTKSTPRTSLSMAQLASAAERFIEYARARPHEAFLLTKVGCGLAGFREADVARLFSDASENVMLVDENVRPICLARDWCSQTV